MATFINKEAIGAAGGVAGLDADRKVPRGSLPAEGQVVKRAVANYTYALGLIAPVHVYETPFGSTSVTFTLPTTAAVTNGETVRVVRSPSATGAGTLTVVSAGLSKVIGVGESALFSYDGAGWIASGAGTAGAAGKAGDSVQTVVHGSVASTARPVTSASVVWVGAVEPTNGLASDIWLSTAPVSSGGTGGGTDTGGGTTTPTTPSDGFPSDYLARWEAADFTVADGAAAGSWANRKSGGAALVPAGGPVVKVSGSRRSVLFDGVDDKMEADIGVTAQPFTKLILARFVTAAASKNIIGGISGSSNIATQTGGLVSMTNGTVIHGGVPADTSWHLFRATSNGASSEIAVDAVVGTGNPGTQAQTGIRLAQNVGGTVFSNLEVAAVAFFPRVLTAAELTTIRNIWIALYPGTIS